MDIQELRIGNIVNLYVSNGDEKLTIHNIVIGLISKNYLEDNRGLRFDFEDIQPIPLSEEILLKADYKDLKDGEFLSSENLFCIYKSDGGKFEIFLYQTFQDDVYLKHIQYLHELQNLHFDLGQELEIKL